MQIAAGTSVVEFTKAGDRWQHAIRIADGRVWHSVEGAGDGGDPQWPRSPVLTEVSRIDVGGTPALLGIGLAGRSHFSLCVTAHPKLTDTLLFEAAVRIHAAARWLGSTYESATEGTPSIEPFGGLADPPRTIRWTYTVGPGGLRNLPDADGPAHR